MELHVRRRVQRHALEHEHLGAPGDSEQRLHQRRHGLLRRRPRHHFGVGRLPQPDGRSGGPVHVLRTGATASRRATRRAWCPPKASSTRPTAPSRSTPSCLRPWSRACRRQCGCTRRTSRTAPWPASGEIDFAEFYSEYPGLDVPYIHYSQSSTDPNVTSYDCLINQDSFNTYGVDWTPTTDHRPLQRPTPAWSTTQHGQRAVRPTLLHRPHPGSRCRHQRLHARRDGATRHDPDRLGPGLGSGFVGRPSPRRRPSGAVSASCSGSGTGPAGGGGGAQGEDGGQPPCQPGRCRVGY